MAEKVCANSGIVASEEEETKEKASVSLSTMDKLRLMMYGKYDQEGFLVGKMIKEQKRKDKMQEQNTTEEEKTKKQFFSSGKMKCFFSSKEKEKSLEESADEKEANSCEDAPQ